MCFDTRVTQRNPRMQKRATEDTIHTKIGAFFDDDDNNNNASFIVFGVLEKAFGALSVVVVSAISIRRRREESESGEAISR